MLRHTSALETRLLDTTTLELVYFHNPPSEYTILSHCWGDEEVSFQEWLNRQTNDISTRKGFLKVSTFCARALRDGYSLCWVDTCCIDKSSSAELSEVINSMYQWYEQSSLCYVDLADLKTVREIGLENLLSHFHSTRWLERGWTLQGLIAPADVAFFNEHWTFIGTKGSYRILWPMSLA